MKPVPLDWAKMKNVQKIHRLLYAIGLGPLIGRIILLLTTTGRKSGMKRVTPLQYEKIGEDYYVGRGLLRRRGARDESGLGAKYPVMSAGRNPRWGETISRRG